MEICSDGHGEICFETGQYGMSCPACDAIKEKQDEIDSLTSDVDNLNAKTHGAEEIMKENEDLKEERDRLATKLEEIQQGQRI